MSEEIKGEMDYMQVKAYLEQARNINIQIDSKLEQVSALRQLARKATSTLSLVPPSGTPNPHRLEDTIIRMMDLEREVDEEIDRLVDLKAEIMKTIGQVPNDRERVVLELRYLAFKGLGVDCRNIETECTAGIPDARRSVKKYRPFLKS